MGQGRPQQHFRGAAAGPRCDDPTGPPRHGHPGAGPRLCCVWQWHTLLGWCHRCVHSLSPAGSTQRCCLCSHLPWGPAPACHQCCSTRWVLFIWHPGCTLLWALGNGVSPAASGKPPHPTHQPLHTLILNHNTQTPALGLISEGAGRWVETQDHPSHPQQ